MSYIKVELDYPIEDGTQITFKAPAANTAVEGLKVYYPSVTDSAVTTTSKTFTFVDSANASFSTKNITAFAADSYVNVILNLTDSLAYVQNPANNTVTQGLIDTVTTLATTHATTSKAGIVKVGNGLSVTSDGTLSSDIPTATKDTTGVIKVGEGLSVTGDGTVSSNVSESYVDNKISELKIVMSHQYSFFESGTFIKPKGLTTFNVLAIGGKGGDCEGDGADTKSSCGGGGRGGTGDVVYKQLVFAEEEMSIPFTIGENGANGKTSEPASVYVEQTDYGTNGKDGGSTLFGTYVTAIGGQGGKYGSPSVSNDNYSGTSKAGDGGAGGDGYYGGKGGTGGYSSGHAGKGGNGGNGYYGGDGGNGGVSTSSSSGYARSGGNGGNGFVGGKGGKGSTDRTGNIIGTAGSDGLSYHNSTNYGQSAQNIPSFVTDLRTPAVYIWW